MRKFRKNRLFAGRRASFRKNHLRLERLEARLALTASPLAANDFYDDLVNEPLQISAPGILANDTSSSGAPLSAGLFSGPSHGTLELADDGSFLYQPEADYAGLDSFLYFSNDGSSDSMLAAVTIRVGDGGPPPVAADDAYSVDEDGLLGVAFSDGVLANDTAAEGESLSASLLVGPAHGSLTLAADGSLNYQPSTDFSGTDSFTYTAATGQGQSATATATITVNSVNDKPAVANDSYTLAEDATLTVDSANGLLANDSDIDGDTLTPTITSQPLHGTVSLAADGSFSYTPEANYNGLDGFSYLVSDGTATSAVASATFVISGANDLPVGVNDEYTTEEDTPLEIPAPGVLANDTDIDGDALSSFLVNPPEHGSVTLGADGGLVYTPSANFHGSDGFTYLANDGAGNSDATAVTIEVTSVSDLPVAAGDSYSTDEDTALTIDATLGLLANDTDGDGDPLTAALVAGPASGALTLNADGSFNYAPNANFNGTDSFTYQASDGALTSETVTTTITVNAINDAPTAAGDAYSLDQRTTLTVDAAGGVLTNDSDLDGDSLSTALVTGPANGSLTLNADGSFVYAPSANFSGTDSFVYAAGDGAAQTQATVTLTVNPVAQSPIVATDNYSTGEDVPLVVGADLSVLANDINPDGGDLTAEVVTGPAHGALTLNSDGTFTFTPEANFHGADSFTYKAINNGQEMISSANIVIEPLNDAPAAVNDEFDILPAADQSATVMNVVANDTDIDGDSLAASLVSGPTHGSLSLNADGTFSYTPEASYSGDDAFRYQLFDGKANSNVATVTLHVAGNPDETPPPEETPPPVANLRPEAVNDVFTMESGATLNMPAATGLLVNDSDPNGDPITATLFNSPLHGAVTVAADGSFSYTPTSDYVGMDAFLYRVSDGQLNSAMAAVTIYVTAADGPSEAPLPQPEPAPTPTPDPAPEPCHPHVCCEVVDHVEHALEHAGHHFADAIDHIFGHVHWWRA